jgi:hypothetical protein
MEGRIWKWVWKEQGVYWIQLKHGRDQQSALAWQRMRQGRVDECNYTSCLRTPTREIPWVSSWVPDCLGVSCCPSDYMRHIAPTHNDPRSGSHTAWFSSLYVLSRFNWMFKPTCVISACSNSGRVYCIAMDSQIACDVQAAVQLHYLCYNLTPWIITSI